MTWVKWATVSFGAVALFLLTLRKKIMNDLRTVTFINPGTSFEVPGVGVVNSSNLTPGLYDKLVALSPTHTKYFKVKTKKEETKPKK